MHEVELMGLDGGNLLGFLAAVGTLRVLSLVAQNGTAKMLWRRKRGWLPVLQHSVLDDAEAVLDELEKGVCGDVSISDAWNIGSDLTLSRDEFARRLRECLLSATNRNRVPADFLAAFGSEAVGAGPKKEQMSDTEFRTMSGAGHQHFLGFMKELARDTGREHLRRALFEAWDYLDGRPSLRWDPADYRPHALRAEDPSGDPIRTMRGANRLAVEALPLFPTAPVGRRLCTVGFEDRGETEVSWPIWREPLDTNSVASLLALSEIQEEKPSRSIARARGVLQVLRARRFTEGKYRNFSPARELL